MEERIESYKTERREKDANDKKTLAGVMDKKTRSIIDKLLIQGMLKEVRGVISVGKEASIYLGVASPDIYSKLCSRENKPEKSVSVAIKVYKTSAMVFKDRERYITGERRFKRYSKGNSRKLVKLWAEKEVRNLNRLQKKGVPSPKPLFLRRNVMVMTMIGDSLIPSEVTETRIRKDAIRDKDIKDADAEKNADGKEELQIGTDEEPTACSRESTSSDAQDSCRNRKDICGYDQYTEWSTEDNSSSSKDSACDTESTGSSAHSGPATESNADSAIAEVGIPSATSSWTYSLVLQNKIGSAAPNLKKANLREDALQDAYEQTVCIMRKMVQECGLVHADLSEYNLLYWQNTVYVIDVSQSVEKDHPNAIEFLRMDIYNVNRYFSRQGAQPLPDIDLFEKLVQKSNFLADLPLSRSLQSSSSSSNASFSSSELSSSQSEEPLCEDKDKEKRERKAQKKEVKEAAREKRKTKLSKKDKLKLSRKIRVSRKKR